jgi:hypothetical protein
MSTAAVSSPEVQVRTQDGLAVLAFLLSLFVMVLPLEAGMLDVLLRQRRFVIAGIVAIVCFAVVFTPFLFSWRRRRRQPQMWRGRGYLIAAGVILTLNVLFVGTLFIYQLFR